MILDGISSCSSGSIDRNGAWLFWACPPDEAFVKRLDSMGQLEPVLVAEEGGRILLVSGYKRILACERLGRPVQVRSMAGDDRHKGRVYLHLNLHRRPTGPDLVRAARFFQTTAETGETASAVRELEDLVPSKMLLGVRQWLHLEPFWEAALYAGRVPFEAGPLLASLGPADRSACEPFFESLSWSWNKTRYFLNPLLESAGREGLDLASLMHREGLANLLVQGRSPNDIQKELLQQSVRIRYPVLTELEQSFAAVRADCLRKSRWRVQPEQHFESNGLNLQTRIRNQQELAESLEQLRLLSAEAAFEPIWQWQREHLD